MDERVMKLYWKSEEGRNKVHEEEGKLREWARGAGMFAERLERES